jgi:hypothetical protein
MGDAQPPPTLDYETTKRNPWTLADLRHGWPALVLLAFILMLEGGKAWKQSIDQKRIEAAQLAQAQRRAALQLAEKQYNTRVGPLLQADPRFHWVFKVGEAGYITNSIAPTGVVDSATDREALRVILQGASPPMPLNMQFVTVSPSVGAATRASLELTRLQARREREQALEAAEREYNERVAPLLQREPRFRDVLVHRTTGWMTNRVKPFGFVETVADREALRKLLQEADPPMPLSFEYVFVTPERFSTTRPSTHPARGRATE